MKNGNLSSVLLPCCMFTLLLYHRIVSCERGSYVGADASTSALQSATITTSASASALVDYCLNESFNASCDPGHVILVTSARFGRMRPGRCISGDFNVGCVKDVKRLLDSACALRISCDVSVRSFVDLHPCQRDFVSYLEASYECIRVSGLSSEDQCPTETSEVRVAGLRSGYLARPRWSPPSFHNPRHSIGTSGCPWALTVELGQKINISISVLPAPINAAHLESFTELLLIDEFSQVGIRNNDKSPCSSTSASTIDVVVDDLVAKRRTHVRDVMCSRPERHLFTSSGNKIRIHVTGDVSDSGGRTLLMHFAAVGCPELLAPSGASVKKLFDGGASAVTLVGDNVMIRCNDSMETWYLTCQSNRWLGEMGNCTMKSVQPLKVTERMSNSGQYHFDGVVIAILIGVVLGIVIGMLLLLVLHCVRRRSYKRQATNTSGMALLTTRSHKMQSSEVQQQQQQSVLSPPVDIGYPVNTGGLLMDVQTRLHVMSCDCDHDLDFDLEPQFTYSRYSSPGLRHVQLDYCNELQIRSPFNNTLKPIHVMAAALAAAVDVPPDHVAAALDHQQQPIDDALNS